MSLSLPETRKAQIGSEGLTDRVVERLNEQLLDVLSAAGLTPGFQGTRGLQQPAVVLNGQKKLFHATVMDRLG